MLTSVVLLDRAMGNRTVMSSGTGLAIRKHKTGFFVLFYVSSFSTFLPFLAVSGIYIQLNLSRLLYDIEVKTANGVNML